MGRKKKFSTTDISIPEIDGSLKFKNPSIQELIANPIVEIPPNTFQRASLSFAEWYGGKIDAITYICHVQILRFFAKQDKELEVYTVCSVYTSITRMLDFAALRANALDSILTPQDINRQFLDEFIRHLSSHGGAITSHRNHYAHVKCLLVPLGRRGIIEVVTHGKDKTFPTNPFPNSNKLQQGETPLTNKEKKAAIKALRAAILPIWDLHQPLTSDLISYCLLVVAFHTGRNTTPLREMTSDCLRPHPKDNTYFLSLWKHRGHNTSKIILQSNNDGEGGTESTTSIRFSVERLIRQVIFRTALLRNQHPEFDDCIWLYHSQEYQTVGTVKRLSPRAISSATTKLVSTHGLTDANGDPLRLNISRFRKTFANRVYEILDGDIYGVASALGNTARVTDTNYLAASLESKKKWRFMGEILVSELLTKTIGATYHQTPVAKCSNGSNTPDPNEKQGLCTSFLNCLRCRHFVITAEDLYKLFSFYFRIYSERNIISKHRWEKELSHIPRLIDIYVIAEGLRRGIFKQQQVDDAKALAHKNPHPFWSADTIPTLEVIA